MAKQNQGDQSRFNAQQRGQTDSRWKPLGSRGAAQPKADVIELTDEEKALIEQRRERTAKARAEAEAKSGGKKPVAFKKYEGGKVLVINHHWSWVVFKDFFFWSAGLVVMLSAVGYLLTTLSLDFFALFVLIVDPLIFWWRIRFWQKDCWEIDLSDGALRDVNIPWHQLSVNKRVAGGKGGLANWEAVQPFPAWLLGRVGHIEFEAVAEKENALEGIKYPNLIDQILAQWRNGESREKIEVLYNEWRLKKTPIERLFGWVFVFFRYAHSKTKRQIVTKPRVRQRKRSPVVERLTEEPEGVVTESDTRVPIVWQIIFDQPDKPITSCGLTSCKEVVGGRLNGDPAPGLVLKIEGSEKTYFFDSLNHFDRAKRHLEIQRDPGLKGFQFNPKRLKFVAPED